MIYLHTSALIRLAAADGDPLCALVRAADDGIAVSSELSRGELAAARLHPDVLRRAHAVLDAPAVLDVAVSDLIRESAESLAGEGLDVDRATHLATALSLGTAVTSFACEDPVLGAAAGAHGMRIVTPPFGSRRQRPANTSNCGPDTDSAYRGAV
jgi:hypothetical protein